GVEQSKGVKDAVKVREFVVHVRSAMWPSGDPCRPVTNRWKRVPAWAARDRRLSFCEMPLGVSPTRWNRRPFRLAAATMICPEAYRRSLAGTELWRIKA